MRKRILFIDDESINLMALKAVFRRDFDVLTANTGEEALPLASEARLDAIVSDQRMPGMTGTEFFERLPPNARPGLRIILTGYAADEDIASAKRRGLIDAILEKPLVTKVLVTMLTEGKALGPAAGATGL